MKPLLKRILFFIVFWLLFFAFCRLFFVFSVFSKLHGKSTGVVHSFIAALPMDLSATAYIGLLPLIVLLISFLLGKMPLWKRFFNIYMIVSITAISVLTVIDMNLYREWGSKVGFRALKMMLDSPKLAFASSESSPVLMSLFSIVVLTGTGIIVFRKFNPSLKNIVFPSVIKRIVFVAVTLGLFIISVRGGISISPITISTAYFSSDQVLNQTAINTSWNFIRDIIDQEQSQKKIFKAIPASEATQICDSLFRTKDSVVSILKTNRPNIVLIILESFTSDLVEELDGEKGITPFFSSLTKQGLFFTNIHSTGFRTDIGFTSILSGFPALATKSILTIPDKAKQLPSLSSSLFKNGYRTSFYYGGESEFFNLRSFVVQQNFQHIVDVRDFSKSEPHSKWGVFDHVTFNRVLEDVKKDSVPFFTTMLTLSNHEPFELPSAPKFAGKDMPNQFRSTAYYTDDCLKNFFESASKESWYNNTLFILVADHGHRLPKNENEVYEPRRSHIPLLFAGNVLKDEYKGKQMKQLAAQVDIPYSVLSQLGIAADEYIWSKNLFNPFARHFAFYSFDNGFTWMDDNGTVAFDNNGNKIIYQSSPHQTVHQQKAGQAFQQQVYNQFLAY